MKPHICPKCEGKKEVINRYPDVKLCDECSEIYLNLISRYTTISITSTIFREKYCQACKDVCRETYNYEKCNICSGSGIVWEGA
jgi:hypothetical protein